MNDNGNALKILLGIVIGMIITGSVFVFSGDSAKLGERHEMMEKCEAQLPRHLNCVITAIPE